MVEQLIYPSLRQNARAVDKKCKERSRPALHKKKVVAMDDCHFILKTNKLHKTK